MKSTRRWAVSFLMLLFFWGLSIFPLTGEAAARARTPAEVLYDEGVYFFNAYDYSSAFDRFSKAAEQGHIGAQFYLGVLTMAKDERQAAQWIHKAAEQGHANAQFILAEMYEYGLGVAKDEQQAAHWYLKAAEQGLGSAQKKLSDMYLNGIGVAQDIQQSLYWRRKASSNPNW